ncbi:MAG TPA: hypothetical protein VK509_08665 [Polyangiales bacterium]|nr:hypothetical protein [Polyangiales bacterium]
MRSAARAAWIAGWLAWWLSGAGAHAQSAEEQADAAPEHARAAPRSAVFLLPDVDAETQARLRDALLAQFSLVDVRLVLEPAPALDQGTADRMGAMEARAAAFDALAAFSIDEHADGRWFVYLLDIERVRLLVRPLQAGGERRNAAIEAVAVMAREATRALLEGAPIPEALAPEAAAPERKPEQATVAPDAVAAPAPPMSAPEHAPGLPPIKRAHLADLRLWLAYAGTDFAKEVGLRHGAAAGVGWLGLAPWYAALSAELTPPVEIRELVAFQVVRVPLHAHLGHRYQHGKLFFDLEVAFTAELLRRSSDRNQPATDGVVVQAQPSADAWLVALGPRARVELLVFEWAGVAAELGFDTVMNTRDFRYLAVGPDTQQTFLEPRSLRPVWSLSMAFYP